MGKHLATVLMMSILSILCSCSGGGNGDQPSSNTKYLAKNVILGGAVTSAFAQTTAIDTTTQILASNVIYETSEASQISSNNVQGALNEISLRLSEVMVGAWNIQNHNQETAHESTGNITINSDGTFNLTAGSFAAIGMGSGTAPNPMCNHTQANQTYQVFTEDLAAFVHYNATARNSVIPRLVKLRQNEIVFVGDGGCGQVGLQRISILTRAQ